MATALSNIPQLAQIPRCAYPAYGAIAAAGCGPDIACICANDHFFITLQGVLYAGNCTPPEIPASLSATRSICVEAVPWLNDNRGPEVVGAITVMSILSTIAVILRVMARRMTGLGLGVDDWLIIGSLIWAWALSITQYFAVHLGFGRHMLMLDVDQIIGFAKAFVAASLIFGVAVFTLKLSFLFFYHRIFSIRRYTIASIIIGVAVVLAFISYELVNFLTCVPFRYYWDKSIKGHCVNTKLLAYTVTLPPDILTNIAILVLPVPYLWSLQMKRAKKIAISGIFVLGSFAVLGSIIRIPFFNQLKETDISYTIVNAGIWLNVECNIGVLSACLPLLRPLFGSSFASIFRSQNSSKPRRASRYYGAGSQRLPDVKKNNVLSGGGKGGNPRSWYNYGVANDLSVMGTTNGDRTVNDGSEEDIIPMGTISVRHDFDLNEETRSRRASVVGMPPHAL